LGIECLLGAIDQPNGPAAHRVLEPVLIIRSSAVKIRSTGSGRRENSGNAQSLGHSRIIRKRRIFSREISHYLFVAPAVLFLMAFLVYPILFNVKLSFQEVRAESLLGGDSTFVWFGNYVEVLASPLTRTAILNSTLFTAASLAFQLLISFALALLYQKKFPGSNLMRSLYFLGWSIPVIVSALRREAVR